MSIESHPIRSTEKKLRTASQSAVQPNAASKNAVPPAGPVTNVSSDRSLIAKTARNKTPNGDGGSKSFHISPGLAVAGSILFGIGIAISATSGFIVGHRIYSKKHAENVTHAPEQVQVEKTFKDYAQKKSLREVQEPKAFPPKNSSSNNDLTSKHIPEMTHTPTAAETPIKFEKMETDYFTYELPSDWKVTSKTVQLFQVLGPQKESYTATFFDVPEDRQAQLLYRADLYSPRLAPMDVVTDLYPKIWPTEYHDKKFFKIDNLSKNTTAHVPQGWRQGILYYEYASQENVPIAGLSAIMTSPPIEFSGARYWRAVIRKLEAPLSRFESTVPVLTRIDGSIQPRENAFNRTQAWMNQQRRMPNVDLPSLWLSQGQYGPYPGNDPWGAARFNQTMQGFFQAQQDSLKALQTGVMQFNQGLATPSISP